MPKNNTYFSRNLSGTGIGAAIDDIVSSAIGELGTSILVRVEDVNSSDTSIAGKVDVLPLVKQQDANGVPYPREVIRGVPYLRIQGGTSALIIDPSVGDIGFIVVAGRDMTNAILTREPSPPASFRQHSMSDCVYVGGFLNNSPNQFIQATAQGWRIVTPGSVSIEAQGGVQIKAAGITANCDISTTGDVKAGSISLKQHTHGGVQAGGMKTSPPE